VSLDSNCTVGQLDLRRKKELGNGNHSRVFLAPLTLPSYVGPTTYEVAVKVPARSSPDMVMLGHEAEIYQKFPVELQESTPSSPPVVPKFYGYYVPAPPSILASSYEGDDGDEEDASTVRKNICELLKPSISHILLLEPCGKQVRCKTLSKSDK
jgi:hypothetical protein